MTDVNRLLQSGAGCDIVSAETNFGELSKEERMARRRFQDPKPKRRGKWWTLLYWQDEFRSGTRQRKRRRIKLASATMPEREVRKIAAEALRPINQGLITISSVTTFEEYIKTVYVPTLLPLMARSTRERYLGVIKNHLKPNFSGMCLRDITPLALQRYISGLADSSLALQTLHQAR